MGHDHSEAEDTASTDEDGLKPRVALREVTDKNQADILVDIVGHPNGLPSVEELDYMNPHMSNDEIRNNLKTLIDADIVEERKFSPGDRDPNFPYKFYRLRGAARELFDRSGILSETAWNREYQSVKKTARIQEIEDMLRPDTT